MQKGTTLTIFLITILVPLVIWPFGLDNIFATPKKLVLYVGLAILLIIGSETLRKLPGIVIALIALNLFSLFYTENYYYTKVAATMNIACLLLYFFVSQTLSQEKHLIWLLYAISGVGVVVAFVCYLQVIGYPVIYKTTWVYARTPIGTVGNSNHTGCYLLFPLFASLGLCFILDRYRRIIPMVALAVVFGAFLLTRARASWLAFGLTLPVALWLLTRTKKALIATAMCVTFAVAVAWTMFPNSFLQWTETTSLKEREKYFQASYHLWMKSPLYGTGLWSYRNMVYEAQAELQEADNTYFNDYLIPKPRRVHNEYLEILNDGGILAAVLLSIFLYSRMKNTWKVWSREGVKSDGQSQKRYIAATLFSCMVAVMISAFFMFPFRVITTLTLTAIILGAMEGLYCKEALSAQS